MTTEKLFDLDEYKNNLDLLVNTFKTKGCVDSDEVLRHLTLSQITRAADALEEIASKLERIGNSVELLEKLSDCVYEPEPFVGGSMLCVKGMPMQRGNEKAGKMKIMTQARDGIIDYPKQMWMVKAFRDDPDRFVGYIMCDSHLNHALGEYPTVERAKEVLTEIFEAQRRGAGSYYMPKE